VLRITGLAVGGDGVGRDDSGRVVFVPGAVPGDVVDVALISEHKRFARAEIRRVVEPSPDRIAPRCERCGGCGLGHVHLDAQRMLRRTIVIDALERIGRVTPDVRDGPPLDPWGYRTTVRVGVVDGRAALRTARSHDLAVIDACPVLHPLLEELVVEGDFGANTEVVLRVGARTGERLVAAEHPVRVPADVRRDHIHEIVDGHTYRVSAASFFQSRPDGAEALVAVVRAEVGAVGSLVDAYSGVGLFSRLADHVVAVERAPSSVADARHNVPGATVVESAVEDWAPTPADAVVADPARRGLGATGVAVLAATGAERIVLVSCDAGSLGRDTLELAGAGYRYEHSTLVDLFPHTAHVEVVSLFRRVD
jgi:tRNA/tmRNA/rRNA uracil-C5-methylase (TrmA/RlmC/RlmD family)